MSGSDESPRSGEPAAERATLPAANHRGGGDAHVPCRLVNHRTRRSEPGLDGGTRRRAGGGAPPGGPAGVEAGTRCRESGPPLVDGRTGKPGTSHPAPTGRSRAGGCPGGETFHGEPAAPAEAKPAMLAGDVHWKLHRRPRPGSARLQGEPSRRNRANTAPSSGIRGRGRGQPARPTLAVSTCRPASTAFRPHRIAPTRFRPPGGCRLSTRPRSRLRT